jgi:hypothetical protein
LEVALTAKAVTNTIPIVFVTADDPVVAGVVNTYSRPGGNVTGVRLRAGDEQIVRSHDARPARDRDSLIHVEFRWWVANSRIDSDHSLKRIRDLVDSTRTPIVGFNRLTSSTPPARR